ncbi:hypothetical protein FE782_11460 [Paenibacillus antri]|uniref:Uncharacterized protein n=1 Tax=Paenibacillus antri TaxID=2582848 RepID=A0A5R9G8E1_9BACL|nr:hypothetical protein [Paenibacillus antri]TLS51991.1 hypothetical protein FE782_11460 [Paenibacillus antri]
MPKLKKTLSTKIISLYRSDNGVLHYRFRDSDIRRFPVPRWARRTIATVFLLAVAGMIAYKPAMNYISSLVMEQVSDKLLTAEEVNNLLQEPEIQRIVAEQLKEAPVVPVAAAPNEEADAGAEAVSEVTSPAESAPDAKTSDEGSKATFGSREEATKFLLTRFSMSELNGFASMAGGGLTAEEKQEIKTKVLEKISPEEFEALKRLAVIELAKKQTQP